MAEDSKFTDVTLACEDGCQMEAHQVILVSSSPFSRANWKETNIHTHCTGVRGRNENWKNCVL